MIQVTNKRKKQCPFLQQRSLVTSLDNPGIRKKASALQVRQRSSRRLPLAVMILSLIMILSATATSFADTENASSSDASSETGNPVVTVDIPLKYVIKNERALTGDVTCKFTLKAATESTPMPDGKTGGEKTITMTKSGNTHFGEINYTVPDVYAYTVVRSSTSSVKGLQKDNAEYNVLVCALNNGEGSIIIKKTNEEGKSDLVYADTFKKKTVSSVGTGDLKNPLFILSAAMFFLFAMMLLFFIFGVARPYEERMKRLENEIHEAASRQ